MSVRARGAKRVHAPPGGTWHRACREASSHDSAPSIVWIVHVISDGADAIEERVNGEETRGLWRGRDVILVITHRLFSRERRLQRCTTVLFSVTIALT